MKEYLSPTQEEKEFVTQWIDALRLSLDQMPRGQRWDADDLDDLRQMVEDGCDWERIALAFNSFSSVRSKWHDISMQDKAAPRQEHARAAREDITPTVYLKCRERSRGWDDEAK